MKRTLFCAALLAMAAPLRAGEAAWLTSANHEEIIQLPPDWAAVAVVPGLTPKGIKHAFSLAPASRAFVLDISAEEALNPKAASAETHFARARKLAGNPRALRAELPDYSLFEYFNSSAAVKGRAEWRVQGVLYKYVQRYWLTFSSAKAYPGDKDWKGALQVLATLDPVEPSAGAWKEDFLKKISDVADPGDKPAAVGGGLRFMPATRADGTPVSFEDIALFGCANFLGNQYLFNENQTAHCWIATQEDYKTALKKLDEKYWEEDTPDFQDCPQSMRQERACDMEKLRNF